MARLLATEITTGLYAILQDEGDANQQAHFDSVLLIPQKSINPLLGKANLAIYSQSVKRKPKVISVVVISISRMDFAAKASYPGPITHTINIMCLPLNYIFNSINYWYAQILTTLHKRKADVQGTKVNATKDRTVCVDKNKP